jgi:DNA-directed RNA polymerase subunit M/transcription elongation factor TFIIS
MYKVGNAETFRKNIHTMLHTMLFEKQSNKDEHDDIKQTQIVINLERGIYNYSIQEATKRNIIKKWENTAFLHLYIDRLRSIYHNLKYPLFLQRIQTGEILPQDVAFMTHQEFQPTRWEVMLAEKQIRHASKFHQEITASTSMYQCKRCKSRKCIYMEQQVRSADEPSTIFVTCLSCGKRWCT